MYNALLLKARKLLRTDTHHLSRGTFWLGSEKAILAVSTIILSVALANLLPVDVFGQYRYIVSVIGFITAFSLSGIGLAAARAIAQGYEGSLRSGFRAAFIWDSVVFLAGLSVGVYYCFQNNYILGISIFIASLLQPLILSSNLYLSFLNGKMNHRWEFYLRSFQAISSTSLLIPVIFITNDVIVLVTCYFAIHALTGIICYIVILYKFRPNEQESSDTLKHGIHLSLMTIVSQAVGHIDKILIFQFLGPAQLAIYAFASIPYSELKSPSKIIGNLALPKMSNQKFLSIHKSLHRKVLIFFMANVLVASAYIVSAPFLFELLFPAYTESVIYSQVLALGLLASPAILYTKALIAHMKKRELLIVKLVTPLTRLLLFVTLLPPYGLWGMVIGFTAGEFMYFIIVLIMFLRTKKLEAVADGNNAI